MAELSLIEVRVTNFRSFVGSHTATLARNPGLYFIKGENKLTGEANGAGKSTLFVDALLWAFFGVLEDDARPGSSIVPWDASGAKSEVEVTFETDERHVLFRTRGLTTLDNREATADEIIRALGMSQEMFRRSVVLGQFSKLFLDLRPEEQTALFNEAVDVSKLVRAAASAGSAAKLATKAVEQLMATQQRLEGEEAATIASLKAEKARSRDWESKHDETLEACSGELGIATTALEKHDAVRPKEVAQRAPGGLHKLTQRKRELEKITARAEADYDSCVKGLERLLDKGEHCPTCGQAWPDDNASYVDLVKEAKRAKVEAKEVLDLRNTELEEVSNRLQIALTPSEAEDRVTEALAVWTEEHRDLEKSVTRLETRLETARQETNPHTATIKDLKSKKNELGDKIDVVLADIQDAQARAAQAQSWAEGFKVLRLDVINSVTDELSEAVNRHVAALGLEDWRIEFATERETQSGTVSLGFNASVYPPGAFAPVRWKAYSGGERQRMQLAMTFGLNEVLLARAGVVPNIEVYDEPSKGLSPRGLADLVEYLAERAEKTQRAIYLVDHHSLKSGAFNEVITVQKDENGSRVLQ